MHITYRKTCRVCGSSSLTKVIDLGYQFLQGSFVKPGKELPPLRKVPCTLVRCDNTRDENACGLLQMEHSVPPEILYAAYWYRSGTNNTMRNHLNSIVKEVLNIVDEKTPTRVLDIGCNDGTLLSYYPDTYEKYGIDPSDVAQEVKSAVVVQDVFPSQKLEAVLQGKLFGVITSIAMFYDLESPVDFVKSIKKMLAPDGIWVFEMSYMPRMLELDSYDTICHEHLEYYSFAVLENIVKRADMKIIKISFNDINGGSIRCVATHRANTRLDNAEHEKQMSEVRQREFDLELDTDKPYLRFQERINVQKEKLHMLLKRLNAEGKKVHIYGASTKGNTILQWCNIDKNLIEAAAERNPDKYGARTLGTDIPIISEAESRAMKPDYYLVLPWHFKKEFLQREKEAMERGVGFIFPLPEIEIVRN
jgi:2-polyprenyl-3-methyl-5-hydroxy-6-metoxy-1,4-benzoquinol methylase